MDKEAFLNRVRGYRLLRSVCGQYRHPKNMNLSDVTISKKLIVAENDHAVKTEFRQTWGENARYVWINKDNIMDIHNGEKHCSHLP